MLPRFVGCAPNFERTDKGAAMSPAIFARALATSASVHLMLPFSTAPDCARLARFSERLRD